MTAHAFHAKDQALIDGYHSLCRRLTPDLMDVWFRKPITLENYQALKSVVFPPVDECNCGANGRDNCRVCENVSRMTDEIPF